MVFCNVALCVGLLTCDEVVYDPLLYFVFQIKDRLWYAYNDVEVAGSRKCHCAK